MKNWSELLKEIYLSKSDWQMHHISLHECMYIKAAQKKAVPSVYRACLS